MKNKCVKMSVKMLIKYYFVAILMIVQKVNGQSSQCEVLAAKASLEDRNIVVENSQNLLAGTWVSQGCETRPGPDFLLRIYSFKKDGSYKLIQHYYWDESCSDPKFTIIAHGNLELNYYAPMHGHAVMGNPRSRNITITPHDQRAAKELDELVSKNCGDKRWQPWRKYEEHVVFSTRQFQNSKPLDSPFFNRQRKSLINENFADIFCLGSLRFAFKELHLIKVQLRPILKSSYKDITSQPMRLELLLGDVHTRKEFQERYEPTAFQIALLKHVKNHHIEIKKKKYLIQNYCNICSTLYSNSKNDRTPPNLIKKPKLPAYIWGEWVSTRCESRPMGLFLQRKFGFYHDESYWIGEHKFYSDPFCTKPAFSVTAAGHFFLLTTSDEENDEQLTNSHNIDFNIEKASLSLYSQRMIQTMRLVKNCGSEYWVKNVPQDITETNGCMPLGIVIPSIQYDIVKIEINYEGSCQLMLGQSDTDNIPRTKFNRPTSFDAPLAKCGDDTISSYYKNYNNNNNNLNNSSNKLFSSSKNTFIYLFLIFVKFLNLF